MKYVSTRGCELGEFSDVLLQGLAPDGGLAMPEEIVKFSLEQILSWQNKSYAQLAFTIMQNFISDIPASDLEKILQTTYSQKNFRTNDITPLYRLGNSQMYLLELSNGPSLAFKDVAMQFLGTAFEYVLDKRKEQLNILGATSGDTGSAAEYAVKSKKNINIFMLSPAGRMSPFQQAQMFSLDDKNVFNLSVRGVFDDCQDIVKSINADSAFKAKYKIGAVNSINWGRILAQTVYYFYAYLRLGLKGSAMDVCVPSGNFGNIFAGFFAKNMGLPIRQLVVASNENDVLAEFFSSYIYRVRKSSEVLETSSPSMDIGKASNFERYLYLITGKNPMQIEALQAEIAQGGVIDAHEGVLNSIIKDSGFRGGKSTHQNRIATIAEIYQKYSRLIDPHTADGVFVAQKFLSDDVPMVCMETALPAKFSKTVLEAVNIEPPRPQEFIDIENKPRYCNEIDNNPELIKQYIAQKLS